MFVLTAVAAKISVDKLVLINWELVLISFKAKRITPVDEAVTLHIDFNSIGNESN